MMRSWRSPASGSLRFRRTPAQPGKPGIVAIERHPFAAPLDGERRVPSIGDTRAAHLVLDEQEFEDVPVAALRLNVLAVRLPEEIFANSKCALEQTWYGVLADD